LGNIIDHTTTVVNKNDELLTDSSKVHSTNKLPKRAKEENWQGKASIVFGIAGWILSLLIGIVWVYFFFSLPTIILGIKGLRSYKKHKLLALFGLVLGVMLLVAFLYIPAMVIFG